MKFGYTIVYVPSVSDALAFYEKAFGFQVRFLHESGQYGELESGSTTLAFASHAMGELILAPTSCLCPPAPHRRALSWPSSPTMSRPLMPKQLQRAPCRFMLRHRNLGGRSSRMFVRWRARSLSCVRPLPANPAVKRDCAKARSPLLLRWASAKYLYSSPPPITIHS
jgi:hypothetical protein